MYFRNLKESIAHTRRQDDSKKIMIELRVLPLKSDKPRFSAYLFLVVRQQESYLASLSLSCLICKMTITVIMQV